MCLRSPKGLMPERKLEHTIELTPGSKPLPLKCYRHSNKEKLKRLLKACVKKGWNRHSKSLYGLPVPLVCKNDRSLRMCVDNRGQTRLTVRNSYPLPSMEELLYRLHGARFVTKLDLQKGYHLYHLSVRIAEQNIYRRPLKRGMACTSLWC